MAQRLWINRAQAVAKESAEEFYDLVKLKEELIIMFSFVFLSFFNQILLTVQNSGFFIFS